MGAIKVSSKVDERVWEDLKELADESHQPIAGVLTEAIREYVERRRGRSIVEQHLEKSIAANKKLGRLLAR